MNKKWEIENNEIHFFEALLGAPGASWFGTSYSFDYFKQNTNQLSNIYNLSQEEIDQILKEIQQEENQLSFPDYNSYLGKYTIRQKDSKSEPNGNVCSHEMVQYTGLVEQFNHCKKCGQKE